MATILPDGRVSPTSGLGDISKRSLCLPAPSSWDTLHDYFRTMKYKLWCDCFKPLAWNSLWSFPSLALSGWTLIAGSSLPRPSRKFSWVHACFSDRESKERAWVSENREEPMLVFSVQKQSPAPGRQPVVKLDILGEVRWDNNMRITLPVDFLLVNSVKKC